MNSIFLLYAITVLFSITANNIYALSLKEATIKDYIILLLIAFIPFYNIVLSLEFCRRGQFLWKLKNKFK